MSEPLVATPPGGWTVHDLDQLPDSNVRYELTDGALTVSPSPSSRHQALCIHLGAELDRVAPEGHAVTGAVEIRLAEQLTRIPDVLIVCSEDPGRHWFAPHEVEVACEVESPTSHVEDRITKPALYAKFGIPHYWRVDLESRQVVCYELGEGSTYTMGEPSDWLRVDRPFPVDLEIAALLPSWAR